MADILVEDWDLQPPVEVEALLLRYVQVRRVPMDAKYNVDAIIDGLRTGEPPVVVLNDQRPETRLRFTVGHELGHVLLGWHLGTLLCTPDEDEVDKDLNPLTAGFEREADAFAARLLLPKRFVEAHVGDGVPALLAAAERANLSLPATIRSLAALLPQGYVFAVLDNAGRDVISHHRSPLTHSVGLVRRRRFDRGHLARVVGDEGVEALRGRQVWWGRTNRTVEVGDGTDDWRSIFARILSDAGFDADPAGTDWAKIVAVAGHARGTVKGGTVEQMAGAVDLAYREKPEYEDVWNHPLFEDFVRARCRAFAANPPRRRK